MTILTPQNSPIRFPLGISNYRQLRQGNYLFVDKTAFIFRVIENDNPVLLIPRPRRFGKTLNMSMLKFFFEMKGKNEKNTDENLSDIFEDTAIWKMENGFYQEHFQQYPVVFLTFKDIKGAEWKSAWKMIRRRLRIELRRLEQKYDLFNHTIQNFFHPQRIAELNDNKENSAVFGDLLEDLILALHKITGKKVILLIDEYDAPLLAASENKYWKEAIDFFRPFLSSGFKGQEFLFKGVITGILKIAKESIFSGMNNLDVCTIISHKFCADFGFTEDEVRELAELTNKTQNLGIIKNWYNGYQFGDEEDFIDYSSNSNEKDEIITIYNPWSILKYLERGKKNPQIYWLNTSANSLIKELLRGKVVEYGDKIHSLLKGECIFTQIYQNLDLQTVRRNINALWSLLLFSGYLTVEKTERLGNKTYYHVRIPNIEVHQIYTIVFQELLFELYPNTERFVQYMLEGEVELFQKELNRRFLTTTSFHDFINHFEAIYHVFLLGFFSQLEHSHIVRSNPQTGYGRADIVIIPRKNDGVGVIFEFKFLSDPSSNPKKLEEQLQKLLQKGIKQVIEQQYIAFFSNRNVDKVYQYVIVFHKRRCVIHKIDSSVI